MCDFCTFSRSVVASGARREEFVGTAPALKDNSRAPAESKEKNMKLNVFALLVSAGLVLPSTALAQEQKAASVSSPLRTKNLSQLAKQLGDIVRVKYPDAKIELFTDVLLIRYRSANFKTHLWTPFEDTFSTKEDRFSVDSPEFVIRISTEDDTVAVELAHRTRTQQTGAFRTFYSKLYCLRKTKTEGEDPRFRDITITDRSLPALYRLNAAGLIENLNLNPEGYAKYPPRPFSFYEVSFIVAQTLDDEKRMAKLVAAPDDLKEDFANLRMAFPSERLFGSDRADEDTFLCFNFAYGKATDAAMVSDIKRTVADYADQRKAEKIPAQ